MQKIISLMLMLLALAACAAPRTPAPDPTPTALPPATLAPAPTATLPAAMPNPASVYCAQLGNKLEVHTAADGSQSGICVFPDGATCDEWAYYRGTCGPATPTGPAPSMTLEASQTASEGASGGFMPPGAAEVIADWRGVIKSLAPGAQFDDYFERQDLGQVIGFGIDSLDPAVQTQIKALRDSGKVVHLYGTLLSNVPDYNGSQIQVNRIEAQE